MINKDEFIHMRIEKETKDKLKALADQNETTISKLLIKEIERLIEGI